jgi:hypothetical protein
MALTDKHKRRFQRVTHTLLITSVAVMIVAFILQQIESYVSIGNTLVFVGVIVAIVSTPIRLLGLAHMYHTQGDRRTAYSSMLLVATLVFGAILKWLFL